MQAHLYWISAITYAAVLGIILLSEISANKNPQGPEKSFRLMAFWVLFFCLQDTVWGLCDAAVIRGDLPFFISSSVFHISTVVTTFFWLKYVLDYLGDKVKKKKLYLIMDGAIICFELVLVVVNIFKTTLFTIENGKYVTGPLRTFTFVNQYIVYLVIGIIAVVLIAKREAGATKQYEIVFIFTLAPILLGVFQLMFPEAPFYSLGYFLGCFVVHSFIIAKDRETFASREAQFQRIAELNDQLKEKQKEIDEQFDILKSISGVYDYINLLDFESNTASRFDIKDFSENFDLINDPHTTLNRKTADKVAAFDHERFWAYTDLSTLEGRMRGRKLLASEFKYSEGDSIRALYIRIGDNVDGPLRYVAYALRNISNDRRREEQVYSAMANLVYSLHVFDLENDSVERLIEDISFKKIIGNSEKAQEMINTVIEATCKDEYQEFMAQFVDFSTISERVQGKKYISSEFVGKFHGWTRMTFIPIELDGDRVKKLVVITQIIDSEKNEMINLVYKSSTDELTKLYNRRMYEEELDKLEADKDKLIIVAFDVNGLKTVNDSKGHKAGDEMIIGAGECMTESFSAYGKLFRTGGDEFMAILKCTKEELQKALDGFNRSVADRSDTMVDKLSISVGYAAAEDYPDLLTRELASEADKRMYAAKNEYYIKNGIERRKR